ncbi:hypothetical protein CXB51_004080 [Gossypium anomalum]|uniref:Aminotransferase-like plant mobile domain-containing protein n=1 Tax=Gossypium anomalum TaxID=47600 RepID=A0A8J5ZHH4_9ROSI|nr:hypothetical protein CXB51_004080 [Gossypium anomalum]
MEESITQIIEKNAVVRDWSLKTQREKGDSLVEGSVANLPEHTTVNVRQNNLEDLVRVWNQWDSDTRGISPRAYQCFTFNQEDMTPTIEEYAALSASIMAIGSARYTVLGHIEVAVFDFFERLKQGVNPVPTILAETFRSLYLSKDRKGTIYRVCTVAQCLDFESFLESRAHSIPHVFKNIRSLEAYLKKEWPKEIIEQYWVSVFQNLRAEDYNVESTLDPSFSFAITNVEAKIGYLYSDYGEELDTLRYWFKGNFLRDNLYPQPEG